MAGRTNSGANDLDARHEKGLRDSDMEEESNPVNSELPPLVIPEGISVDELSKVFMDILMRRALSESNPLSKWVLLGASEVLQGRTPKLTGTMLSQLVYESPSQVSVDNYLSKGKRTESVGTQVDLMETKKVEDKASQIQIWKKTDKN